MSIERGGGLLALPETRRLIVGWTVLYGAGSWLLEYAYATVGGSHGIAFAAAGKNAIYALAWAPLLFGAVWLVDTWPVRSAFDLPRFLLHGVAIAIAPFLWGVLTYYACLAVIPGWQPWGPWRMVLKTSMGVLYVCTVVIGICHLARWIRRTRDLELAAVRSAEAATQAQMHVLSLELQPHFLRNALHSVSALIYSDPPRAAHALGELRDLLAHAARTASVAEVPLADEIATLARYARMQELHFGDRLSVIWQISPETECAAIPNFLLQPILENAIKFGVETLSGPRTVIVQSERIGTTLVLRVLDDGVGPHDARQTFAPRRSGGKGLANVRARLARLYGVDQSLSVNAAVDQGTLVEVRLPFRQMLNDGGVRPLTSLISFPTSVESTQRVADE